MIFLKGLWCNIALSLLRHQVSCKHQEPFTLSLLASNPEEFVSLQAKTQAEEPSDTEHLSHLQNLQLNVSPDSNEPEKLPKLPYWPIPQPEGSHNLSAYTSQLMEAQEEGGGKCPVLGLPSKFYVYTPFFQLFPTWSIEEVGTGISLGYMQSSVFNFFPGMKTVWMYNGKGEYSGRFIDSFTLARLFARLRYIVAEDCNSKMQMSIEETIDWWRFDYTVYDKDHKQVAFISSKDVLWDWGIHACTNNPKEEGKCDQGEEIAEAVHHWWQFMYSTRTITISNVGAYKALVTADEVPMLLGVLSMTTKGSTSWAIYIGMVAIAVAIWYFFFHSAGKAKEAAEAEARKAVLTPGR